MIEHRIFYSSHCKRLLIVKYYTCRVTKELLILNWHNFDSSDEYGDHLYKVQSQMANIVATKQNEMFSHVAKEIKLLFIINLKVRCYLHWIFHS